MILLMVVNILIIFGYMYFTTDSTLMQETYLTGYTVSWSQVVKVVAIIPFLFVGFDVIAQVATELNFEPKKATGMAIAAIFSGVLFYNLLNITTGMVYTPEEALNQTWALGSAVLGNMGPLGFTLLIVSLAGAVAGGINGFMLGGSKLIGALSNYRLIPDRFSKVNGNGVFSEGIRFITFVSFLAPWMGREVIIYIVDMSSFLAALTYLYVCWIGMKKTEGMNRFFSGIGVLVSLIFIGLLVIPGSPGQLSGPSIVMLLVWVTLGVFYYKRYASRSSFERAT